MRNLRFPKEYVIVALTKKESTREGSRMKAQDQKELMRERICDCAKRLFEREGYEQVSMRQIAAEAGIAVGNLTYKKKKKQGWDISELIFPALETVELKAKYEVMTLPSKELIGMAHQYNKNISAWNYDKKKFRKEFWKKFLKEIHTIPTEMYATHRASAGSLDDTTYIYTTAVSKEQLTSSANISTMSNVELPKGKYLVITFEMDNILDSLTGYDDIIYTVYTKVLPKMNLLRRAGPDIERYTLKQSVSYDKLIGHSEQHLQEISYYIPVL